MLGIEIPLGTKIGPGFIIKHFSGIAINGNAIIGRNFTLFHNVTIAMEFAGRKKGYPQIGDNVIVYPGCRIIGNIKIGNNVVVGANSVVINDVPDNCIVAGVPAKIISDNSAKYLNLK